MRHVFAAKTQINEDATTGKGREQHHHEEQAGGIPDMANKVCVLGLTLESIAKRIENSTTSLI